MNFAFLKGYKTYVIGFTMFLTALAHFLTGETGLAEFLAQMPGILTGLGIMTLRAGVAKSNGD